MSSHTFKCNDTEKLISNIFRKFSNSYDLKEYRITNGYGTRIEFNKDKAGNNKAGNKGMILNVFYTGNCDPQGTVDEELFKQIELLAKDINEGKI